MRRPTLTQANLALVVLLGFYGLITDEPYWRDVGHGPYLYDSIFWLALALNGPSGILSEILSVLIMPGGSDYTVRFALHYFLWGVLLWPQWWLYQHVMRWACNTRRNKVILCAAAAVLVAAGGYCAYLAWQFGQRPSEGFIDKYFYIVRIIGLACSGAILSIGSHIGQRLAKANSSKNS